MFGVKPKLLDFFVNSHFLEPWIELTKFDTLWSVLTIFLGDVTRHTWHTRGFVLCAFQNHLDAIAFAFLCHTIVLESN